MPTGSGTVEPTLAQAYQASIASCGDLRSLTADIKLSGRVDGRRVRGTLQVGLTRDGGVRIEAVAPFGAPIFTIAGRADAGTLWLPRSREVVRAAPAEILEALTGVALPPSGLFEIVTACPAADDAVVKAERFSKPDLARVSLRSGAEVWWRPDVSPLHPLGARRAGALVEYRAFAGDRPQTVRLGATPGTAAHPALLAPISSLTLQQVETQRRARRRGVHAGRAGRRQGADAQRAAPGRRPALIAHPTMWTASARAKINLHLAVHARRPDGYHALTTVFQTIDLADTLTIVEHDGPFTLRCPGSDAPEDDSNLVVRAARALASELGRPEPTGLLVTLDKQVPTQAGPRRRQRRRDGRAAPALRGLGACRRIAICWRVSAAGSARTSRSSPGAAPRSAAAAATS